MWIKIIAIFVVVICAFTILSQKKLRVSNIIKNYFSIFYDDRNTEKKINLLEFISIFGLPMLISISIVLPLNIGISVISELITIISIMSGLMFSVLSLIIGISNTDNEKYNRVVKETFYAVSFEILIGIIVLFVLIFSSITNGTIQIIINVIDYYLIFIYVVNIFLILKRFVTIFDYKRKNGF